MAKLVHHVTLEVFVKTGGDLAAAERALDGLAPVPMADVRAVQWKWHPEKKRTRVYELAKKGVTLLESTTPGEDGPITVLHYRFRKRHDTASFLERVRGAAGKEAVEAFLDDIEEHLDEDGRLSLRFGQEALGKGLIELAAKGESVFARVNLAAFPKNRETCVAVARQALGEK